MKIGDVTTPPSERLENSQRVQ